MKLCIVTHNVIKGDGQGRANYEVVWEAIRRGHQVTLLASQVAPELQQNLGIQWLPISVKGYPTQLLGNLAFAQKSSVWLQQHCSKFDLIQVNGALTFTPSDVNAVHFVHSSWLRSPAHVSRQHHNLYGRYQWLYNRWNAYWEKSAFRQAKIIIAVSAKVKQELIEIGIPAAQIRVILNGVDLQEFSPGRSDRSQWGLPLDVPLALFAGDIRSSRKNLDTVLRALVEVPDLHLAVAGALPSSPYPQLAATLELSSRVHFLGLQRDMPQLMRAVDLFVFPSRYEACCLVLLEAMASGLPVITALSTGGAELVTPECGIVLSDSEDLKALVQALRTLTRDRQQCSRMGQASQGVAEQHSWQSKAQAYIDLFEELNQ